jgi:N-acetylglucosamine-6-phosphate deacetylase
LEGPFICADEGPRGAHDPRHVRDPSPAEFEDWLGASKGLLRMVTLAPELEGAVELIEEGVRRGVVMAIGHTAASGEQIVRAVAAGASLSTHLGNGSHATVPRLRNYLWEQLGADGLAASVIADGFHLPDSVLRVFARAKGLERLVLVSDVASLGGSEPGAYRWGDVEVEVFPDGHIALRGTPFLAGAGHLLDRDVARFARATGTDIRDAVRLVTSNPEAVLGLASGGPGFRVGERADLTRFTYDVSGGPLGILDTVSGTGIPR